MNWSWLCLFLPHKWEPVVDIVSNETVNDKEKISHKVGLYQCKRCKLISKGIQLKKGVNKSNK